MERGIVVTSDRDEIATTRAAIEAVTFKADECQESRYTQE